MVKVHIITQNEPFFIPKMIKYILENQKDYKVISYTLLSPKRKNKSIVHWFKERARIYSSFELVLVGFLYAYTKLINLIRNNSPYSTTNQFNKGKVPHLHSQDINSFDYIKNLEKSKPNVILSISCPQIFKEKLLSTPTLYSINAHSSLLPRHRGVFATFWTLYLKDKVAGSTLHTMELKLDSGINLWQEEFKVKPSDTQYSLAYKTKKQMAKGIVELFSSINEGRESAIVPKHEATYHRAPSKEQGKILHENGKNIIKVRDIKNILVHNFDL